MGLVGRFRVGTRLVIALLALLPVALITQPSAAQVVDDWLPTATELCFGAEPTVDLSKGEEPTSGDDIILGTKGDDIIRAGKGNDVICGLEGDDIIYGGDGRDMVDVGSGDDVFYGNRHYDVAWVSSLADLDDADIYDGGARETPTRQGVYLRSSLAQPPTAREYLDAITDQMLAGVPTCPGCLPARARLM